MDFPIKRGGTEKGASPLRNRKRELFCRYYASEFWGRPGKALEAADYKISKPETRSKFVKTLLESSEVRARVKYLRRLKSEISVADDTWIKESLIKIIETAKKDSDRIRALASLEKLLERPDNKKRNGDVNIKMEQMVFPFFNGNDDGDITIDNN